VLPKFEQFIRERKYLTNVSPATVQWYTHNFKWLRTESPSQDDLKDAVLRMREKGLKATGCNSAIRAINSYMHWLHNPNAKCSPSCTHPRVAQLKEPELVLPTFPLDHVSLITSHKPKGFISRRLHLIMMTLFDTGCRIDEVLSLKVADCDCDSLLFTVTGKGRKQRRIPFSLELRRALTRYVTDFCPHPQELLLATRRGRKLGRRVVLRDVKLLCKRLGFDPPARTLHATRHTFAINYLRKGGSVFHLQKVLGHSTLEMTRRYANLMTEDLQAMHERVSLLAGGTK
jgi:integrase/recombinase XerD